MSDALTTLARLFTLLVLLALVPLAIVADLTLVPFMLISRGPLLACTVIAIEAASAGLLRLLGVEDADR